MDSKLLRFLGTAYLLVHSQSLPANARSSEEKLKNKTEKKQQITLARQDKEKEIKTFVGTITRNGDSFTLKMTAKRLASLTVETSTLKAH